MADNDCGMCERLRTCPNRIGWSQFPSFASRLLCDLWDKADEILSAVGGGSGSVVALTPEATFPKRVTVTDAGTGVTVLAANANRKPGSYIQNVSNVAIEYQYGSSITPGAAGSLAPGASLPLVGEGNYVYQGPIHMYQASGVSKEVWIVSFV